MTNLTHISFFVYVYSNLYMFRALVLIIRRINCISTTSGVSLYVGDRLVCIPDGHQHRVTYTRCHTDTISSTDDEHMSARNM